MFTKFWPNPTAACKFFDQEQIGFAKTVDAIRARRNHFANVYHFTRDSGNTSVLGGGKHCHSNCRLRILRQANRPPQNICSKLAPVAVAGRAAGES